MEPQIAIRTVFSIQNDYREIIKTLVSQNELREFKNLDQMGMRLFVFERLLKAPRTVKVPGENITPFEERLNQIAHEVFEFWRSSQGAVEPRGSGR